MLRTALLLTLLVVAPAIAPAEGSESPEGALQARIIEASNLVIPSVVHIEAIAKVNDRKKQVTGSGFIASADGLILTNHHVVEKAEKVTVTVPDRKRKYPAHIVGTDRQTDLAVLQIEPDAALPAVTFGSSSEVRVGQWVLAIGNPYGLEGTVSFGIVSAKGRNLDVPGVLNDFIQTDAMIDRGSSGGPLVDLEGRVIGINSRGQGRGIGFTIPIDTALAVKAQIDRGGVARGWLGVTMQPLDRELARYFGVPDTTGIVVNSVSKDSPAERAGLRPGDILAKFDDTTVEAEKEEDLGTLQRRVASVEPGQRVTLTVWRDGRWRELEAKIEAQPTVEPDESESDAGFYVQEITESIFRAERLATRDGAYVNFVERGSPANEAGLLPGDVIERVERKPIRKLDDFERAMREVESRRVFLLTTRRGDEIKFLLIDRGATATAGEPAGDTGEAALRPEPPEGP
ncbi:MAG: trypsin-like peptidase domain-containing protein [Deltaproteobacteria bacterium]|nr:MAG: trypsin-like peptidase domain-containing protein [Deltaproteobacteria bacterium]